MIQIFRRFFAFSGKENRHKFIRSIFLGVLKAIFEAMKIPAIAVTLHGVLSGDLTVQHILLSFGIMLLSVGQRLCELPFHHASVRGGLWYLRRQAH